ncbi:hypothetical protein MPTK1_2g16230 [Marchantia polymorpha subsp. ruderalis]|uniref:Uncharacterized protein n=1 Tax=Marchantia polymorpha TaxID=3197 RepID=A0A2R6W9U2_MARPO|nr:hypothetical protein MARPO_0122s0041 [Marchantia polymorpha]BBN02556.1 hypothetical protein Mp_2g16230 [Marchantia polymorpha subsp. ruderalis]|eukprot:PTQ30612.1 hypothetical protein MARPO_0122s0041 [Marchantia polymorpha]
MSRAPLATPSTAPAPAANIARRQSSSWRSSIQLLAPPPPPPPRPAPQLASAPPDRIPDAVTARSLSSISSAALGASERASPRPEDHSQGRQGRRPRPRRATQTRSVERPVVGPASPGNDDRRPTDAGKLARFPGNRKARSQGQQRRRPGRFEREPVLRRTWGNAMQCPGRGQPWTLVRFQSPPWAWTS